MKSIQNVDDVLNYSIESKYLKETIEYEKEQWHNSSLMLNSFGGN